MKRPGSSRSCRTGSRRACSSSATTMRAGRTRRIRSPACGTTARTRSRSLEQEIEVRRIALGQFGLGTLPPGTPLSLLEARLLPLYLHHRYQLQAALKSVGGAYFTYAIRTSAGSQPADSAADRRAGRTAARARRRAVDDRSGGAGASAADPRPDSPRSVRVPRRDPGDVPARDGPRIRSGRGSNRCRGSGRDGPAAARPRGASRAVPRAGRRQPGLRRGGPCPAAAHVGPAGWPRPWGAGSRGRAVGRGSPGRAVAGRHTTDGSGREPRGGAGRACGGDERAAGDWPRNWRGAPTPHSRETKDEIERFLTRPNTPRTPTPPPPVPAGEPI